jgi:polyisoprenoid-binding protein YceI
MSSARLELQNRSVVNPEDAQTSARTAHRPLLRKTSIKVGFVKRILATTLLLLCCGAPSYAQTPAQPGREFVIDVPNSKVEFFVGSSAGDVNGAFGSWNGRLYVATPGVPETATLNLEISAASMTTGSGIKDKMVKGPRFFSVDNYPTVSFASTSVTTSGDPNKFQLQGNLTLLGVTKPVTFQVTLDRNGSGGGQIYADLAFDRRDFGMTQNVPFVRVDHSVEVKVNLHVQAKPSQAATQPYHQMTRLSDLESLAR